MITHRENARPVPLLILLSASACTLLPESANEPPPPSPTAASVSEIDLRSFLEGLGDLPAHLSISGITRAMTPNEYMFLPDPGNYAYHDILWDGSEAGNVVLFLYESAEQVRDAYASLVGRFEDAHADSGNISMEIGTAPIAELGEVGQSQVVRLGISSSRALPVIRVDVAFARCSAVVDVRLDGPADLDAAVAYARRLDEGLVLLACR